MKKYDVIIVGAGILGIAHAYHCLKAGLTVAMIEKNSFPQDSTIRNFGQIVPSGFAKEWQSLGRKSLQVFKEIQSEVDITVKNEGTLYLANDELEMGLLEELASINKSQDYESVLLTKAECLQKYEGLKSTYVRGGLYFPQEINLDPRHAASRIIKYLCSKFNLEYIPYTCIKNIVKTNGGLVLTSTRQVYFEAEKVFICSGNEFEILYPRLFEESDLKIVKLQMMDTQPLTKQKIKGSILTGWTIRRYESFQECPSYADIKAKEAATAFHNKNGIHILFKQSPDGSLIIGDSHHYTSVKERNRLGFDTDNEINCFMLAQAQRILDLEHWSIRRTWLGFYCQSETAQVYTRTLDEDIHIVTGIGGKGMTGAFGFAQQHVDQLLSTSLSG